MKKLSIALAVATLIAGFSFADDSNTVGSANVLGYTKLVDPVSNRYILVSAPFNCGTGAVSTLVDIFGTNQLRRNSLSTRCDLVTMWDAAMQQYVSYGQKSNGLFYVYTAFTGSPTNPVVNRGQALWVQAAPGTWAPTSRVIIISGNVPNDGAYTNYITGTIGNTGKVAVLSFIANPYPVAMDLSSLINTNDGARANALSTRADTVMTWDDVAQQYVTYALKASANTNVNNKWLIYSSFTSTVPPVVTIQPGQGFWYSTTNAITWIESKPYTLE